MFHWRSGVVLVSSVLVVGGLSGACSSSDDGTGTGGVDANKGVPGSGTSTPVQTPTKAARTVGNTGGNVTTTGGVGVEIPAGALPNDVQVTVDASPAAPPPTGATELGTPHIFGPSGLQFAKPVTVVLEFDPTKLPAGKTAANIVVFTAPEGTLNYTALPTKVRDATHVEAETTHFSVLVPTIPPDGPASGADAGAGSGGDDAGTGCKPRLCGYYGPGTCGAQSDGCSSTLDCGPCSSGTDAGSGGTDASAPGPDAGSGGCVNPLTCANYDQSAGKPVCGTFDNGCGGKLDCVEGCQSGSDGGGSGGTDASAPMPDAGGSGGTDASAPAPDAGGGGCQPAPVQCAPTDCTTKFDGCKNIDCFGGCDGGSGGGSGGSDASAPAVDAGGACVPKTCGSLGCGPQNDGCGTPINCGPCP